MLAAMLTVLCVSTFARRASAQAPGAGSTAPDASGHTAAPHQAPARFELLSPASCRGAAVLVWRARRRVERGEYLQALSTYSRAVLLEPSCGVATLELARLRARIGDFPEAERLYARAIRLRESAALAYKERAWLRRRQGRHDSALSDLRAALTLCPTDLDGHRELATWYIEKRAWAAALAEYRAMVRLLSSSPHHASLEDARLKVSALAVMAAETDPVLLGREHENWIRRSMSRLGRP